MEIVEKYMGRYFSLTHAVDVSPRQENFVMHMHDSYEVFYFVSGNAGYMVEGTVYWLQPGSLLLMRSSESHKLSLKGSGRYERYTLSFHQELLGRAGMSGALFQAFHNRGLGERNLYLPGELTDFAPLSCFRKTFEEIKVLPQEDVMAANVGALLCAVNAAFVRKNKVPVERGGQIRDEIIGYINENLLSELSLQSISEHVHMSSSQINRIFREATGSSVYHYILLKRMILAREMIQGGESAANAALACGFHDYSSFYRFYKKHFGTALTARRRGEGGT